jgi:TonB family protein
MMPFLRCRSFRRLIVAALATLMFAACAHAADDRALTDRLSAADTGTALDGADVKPWHLKIFVELFDSKGRPSDRGTIEEWWSSPELDTRDYKTTAYTATEIRSGGKLYRTQGMDLPPYYLELLRRQVVHPIPPMRGKAALFVPELRKVNAGKLSLDCIALRSVSTQGPAALGSSPTYCLDATSDSLRMSLDLSSEQIARNAVGRFQGKEVGVDVVVSANGVKAATGHLDRLAEEAVPESEFAASSEAPEVVPPIVATGDPVKLETVGGAVSQSQPIYPVQAKEQRLAGIVVLRVIIGTNGAVRNIQLISSSNSVFEASAIAAVRQWRYKANTVNGLPTEVETIVVVNFNFG